MKNKAALTGPLGRWKTSTRIPTMMEGPEAPWWWTDDEDATDDNFAAMRELTREK